MPDGTKARLHFQTVQRQRWWWERNTHCSMACFSCCNTANEMRGTTVSKFLVMSGLRRMKQSQHYGIFLEQPYVKGRESHGRAWSVSKSQHRSDRGATPSSAHIQRGMNGSIGALGGLKAERFEGATETPECLQPGAKEGRGTHKRISNPNFKGQW